MKKGEKILGVVIIMMAVFAFGRAFIAPKQLEKHAGEIPFYSSANADIKRQASDLYKDLKCRDCHRLWGVNNITQFVPSPSLDGIGSIRSESWLYDYFSSDNPQNVLPTRLKKEYKMPSYAGLPEEKRRLLAHYFSSLKVKDWYLDEVKKMEQEKLTGKKANES